MREPSKAGLPARGMCVSVGPPLLANGASSGSIRLLISPTMSEAIPVNPTDVPESKLKPFDIASDELEKANESVPLPATIELKSLKEPPF